MDTIKTISLSPTFATLAGLIGRALEADDLISAGDAIGAAEAAAIMEGPRTNSDAAALARLALSRLREMEKSPEDGSALADAIAAVSAILAFLQCAGETEAVAAWYGPTIN